MTTNTPKFSFTIPHKLLAAVAEAAPVKADVRKHLNNVLVNITNDPASLKREIRLTASDGAMLATTTFRPPEDVDDPFDLPLEHSVLLPIVTVRNVFKILNGKNQLLPLNNNCLYGFPYTPVDGRFPDLERAWPREIKDNFVPIDPFLMARVAKIIRHGKARAYCGTASGPNRAIVFRCDIDGIEVRGVVMGMYKSTLEEIPKF